MGRLTPELRRVLKLQYPEDIAIEVRGEIVHFKDTEENWERLAKGLGLKVFKEERGTKNHVLYNQKNFRVKINYNYLFLACISEENLELPINCSSCFSMFYDFRFKSKDALKNFDTSEVKDMSFMFYGCQFPILFSLGDKFDTSNVASMVYMFHSCQFPKCFSFGDKFDTRNALNMEWMFGDCSFPAGFSLGDKFDTSNVRNMEAMFTSCKFQDGFSLGGKFDISSVRYVDRMFDNCKLPEGKTARDFNDDYRKIVEWLKSRSSNKTSNTNFFN